MTGGGNTSSPTRQNSKQMWLQPLAGIRDFEKVFGDSEGDKKPLSLLLPFGLGGTLFGFYTFSLGSSFFKR